MRITQRTIFIYRTILLFFVMVSVSLFLLSSCKAPSAGKAVFGEGCTNNADCTDANSACTETDPRVCAQDTDGDGAADVDDGDDDNDGLYDVDDPAQYDPDADDDEICDGGSFPSSGGLSGTCSAGPDNCIFVKNGDPGTTCSFSSIPVLNYCSQADANGDGGGNVCETAP